LRLLRWRHVDLIEATIAVGKSKTEGGSGRLVYLSAMALQTLQGWRSQFPEALPDHTVFLRRA
jgi:integrase